MKAKNIRLVGFLELAALIGLGVGLVFILKDLRAKPENQAGQALSYPGPTDQAEPIPTNPVPIDLGMPTPTVVAVAPPKCEFPGFFSVSDQVAPPAGDYTFSQPKVVLASEGALGIAGWLPDSKRLLLTRDTPHSTQEIFTYDVFSGEEKLYAERSISSSNNKPAWLEDLQAIAYADRSNPLQEPAVEEELRLSYGDPKASELISPQIFGYSMSSDGSKLVYFSPVAGDYPQIWSSETKSALSIPLNLAAWKYLKYPEMIALQPGRGIWTALQPQSSAIAYYGAWMFLSDFSGNHICEIELWNRGGGSLGYRPQWSLDGRFLALVVAEHLRGTYYSEYMATLDLATGVAQQLSLESTYIQDVVWSPDAQTMAVLGRTNPGDSVSVSLFIGNINQSKFQILNVGIPLGGGRQEWQLAWSPDNRMIAVNCSIVDEQAKTNQEQICIIEVKP